ncbi:TetR/AcrR family transcriptional regulator [Microbacterium sp. G2-8]|uniref:TetR/AcrR family transcriptional regulator n=1 Tax=Microbacterium sp. G2-8 TaxID=2842454 RepID=UPI001C8AABFA|nr:TetR/AcrR family transcriptional regulator [Microbacterium sp. G2-8]
MPKIVDREARRQEIIATYLKLVGREGVETVTTRRLAEALGVSTGALWHYFHGFDEVLQRSFERIFAATNERIAASLSGREGLDAVCAMVEQIHPLDKTTQDEASVVVSFWGRIPFKHEMASLQATVEKQWHEDYARHLGRAVERGELTAHAPVERVSDLLMTLVTGTQVEHVFGTPIAEPARQWQLIETVLTAWLTPKGRAAARFEERTASA